eukprot:356657-Chlamydomonas_euryale.AAC.4
MQLACTLSACYILPRLKRCPRHWTGWSAARSKLDFLDLLDALGVGTRNFGDDPVRLTRVGSKELRTRLSGPP